MKRLFLIFTLIVVLAPTELLAGQRQPDIVFILVDDLRWDALSFKNHPYVKTPQIDRLRQLGTSFRNAFVTTSICCPSRATFLTGVYANQHGVIDNETSEYNPDITPPLTKYLQDAGYRTAMLGKWHMGQNARPRRYFDHWVSFKGQGKYQDPQFNINGKLVKEKGYTTDVLNDKAIKFIGRQPKNRPYFLMLSHKAVHQPFTPAPRHAEAFGPDDIIKAPSSFATDMKNKPLWQRRQLVRDVRWDWRTRDVESETVPDTIPLGPWQGDERVINQYRCLVSVDDGVGRIVEALQQRGTLDNTLIIFTSDNGYFHWEHRRFDKRLAYEESLRIPMVMVHPGKIKPESTVTQMVSNLDFAPTVLSCAGLPVPEQMQGRNMTQLFEGNATNEAKQPDWPNELFYEYWVDLVHEIPTMTALRTERHKLIRFPELDDLDELYDLESDPNEMTNLAVDPQHSELLDRMQQRLAVVAEKAGWRANVFPRNLPRVRGPEGIQLDLRVADGQLQNATNREIKLSNVNFSQNAMRFDGKSSMIQLPFDDAIDPSTWPYRIEIEVKPETNGVIATQGSKRFGFKLFVQDGRPGLSVLCKSWIATHTTLDAQPNILGKWTRLKADIDYNRVIFTVDDRVIESRALPQPFKYKTKSPLIVGSIGQYPIADNIPHTPFQGEVRSVRIQRERPEDAPATSPNPVNLFREL